MRNRRTWASAINEGFCADVNIGRKFVGCEVRKQRRAHTRYKPADDFPDSGGCDTPHQHVQR